MSPRRLRLPLLPAVVASALLAVPAAAGKCPNIMLVVDKSGSMLQDPMGGGNPPSKWELVVMNVKDTLARHARRIPFGLTTFGALGGGASCANDSWLEVDLAKNRGPLINDKLQVPPLSQASTNTTEAIHRAINDSRELGDRSRRNYMVLITDGTPNCMKPEPERTIAAITAAALRDPPVHTFVIGFDGVLGEGGVDVEALNRMAIAGREPVPGCNPDPIFKKPCYYSATDRTKFSAAMQTIIGGLVNNASIIGTCDDSCFALGCPNGWVCTIPKVGDDPTCVPDSCAGVTCEAGSYCVMGRCVRACEHCPEGRICEGEVCVPDPCPPAQRELCAARGLVCDDEQRDRVEKGQEKLIPGPCAPDRCNPDDAACPLPSYCDPLTGTCADDPCRLINCPVGTTCYGGYCMRDPEAAVAGDTDGSVGQARIDMAVRGDHPPELIVEACGGGCTLGHGRVTATPLLLALALLFVRRRGTAPRRP